MKTLAAILVELGRPLVLADLDVPALGPGQALVEVAFSGVCHTQVLEARGLRGPDPYVPHCLGHEGSGVVREVGRGVTKVKLGQRVILSWIKGSGGEAPGCKYQWNGRAVNAGGITTFSHYAVIAENRLTPLPDRVALREAALLGCAIPTGLGAVLNTAGARAGQSIVIFGVGGVGLCAVAGAAVAGCTPIIAVDINDAKLERARQVGATLTIHARGTDPIEQVMKLCPGGVDLAIEVTGNPVVMAQALSCVRSRGGSAVIVGNAAHGQSLTLDPRQFNQGKRLLGTWGGDSVPDRDYPRYADLLAAGKINLAPLLAEPSYPLTSINEALNDLEEGRATRPIVDMKP